MSPSSSRTGWLGNSPWGADTGSDLRFPGDDNLGVLHEGINKYLKGAIRPTTLSLYQGYWTRFNSFCEARNLSSLPATPHTVSAFFIFLAEATLSPAGSRVSRSAIAYFHKLNFPDQPAPTESWLAARVLKSVVLRFQKPAKKAEPLYTDQIRLLFDRFLGLETQSFGEERLLVMICLQFFAFLRYK